MSKKNGRIGVGMKPRGVSASGPQSTQETPQPAEVGNEVIEQPEGSVGDEQVSANEVQQEGALEAPAEVKEGEPGEGTLESDSVQNLENEVSNDTTSLEALLARSKEPAEGAAEGAKVAVKIQDERNAPLEELQETVADLESLFELQRTRMGEATRRWRLAHPGKELVLPDLGDLLTWLLEDKGQKERLAELICQHNGYVGERADGSHGVVITIGEGYWNAVNDWAEADGIPLEEWLTNLVTANVETYGEPAKGR